LARVSVVLIFLDAERFIEEAIESVLAQSLTDWELILVDDGSTDGSVAIAKRAADADPRIRYVEHPGRVNLGRSESRNVGAALASSPYLAFIDADDVWDRTKLAEQLDLLEREPDLAMVCGAMVYWHSWNPLAEKPDRLILTGGVVRSPARSSASRGPALSIGIEGWSRRGRDDPPLDLPEGRRI
jgi:glycosyltransferase involved in cell wall biosynthesis